MPKLQLSFHTSFALKKEDIKKILTVAKEELGLNDSLENIIAKTGLGNKKVGPIKSWATRSGLVQGNKLSLEAEKVLDNDPYLKLLITDWFMHFYLSFGDKGLTPLPESPADWGGWTWFIYSFLPEQFTFSTDNLVYEAAQVFEDETNKKLEKNFRYVLRAYTESEALESCQFIQSMAPGKYIAGEASLPNPYLICYFLAKLWQRDYGNTTSVVTDEVLNHKMGLAPVLGLEPAALQKQLDKLETFGLIEQRRTVPPFQIVRRWDDPLSLLEQAYAFAE
ncbi:MAG: DUF4007 family protein [Phormidesmis sp.]